MNATPTASERLSEALKQGQRDREQGWPSLARIWGYTGWELNAYHQGYDHPRVQA